MDARRFDALAKTFVGRRLSRRAALRAGGIGLAGAAGAGRARGAAHAAQEATPGGPAGATPGVVDDAAFLFVQTFSGGTFAPGAEAGTYVLTLGHATAQTVYFSDRPQRIVGTVPTQQFLESLGFTPANPPNAALVAQIDGGEDVLVVELLNPTYDAARATLTYDVRVLENYQEEGLAHLAQRQQDTEPPASFGAASLFIDDCPDITGCLVCVSPTPTSCYSVGDVPGGPYGTCWNWSGLSCDPCRDYGDLDALCNQAYADCDGGCTAA